MRSLMTPWFLFGIGLWFFSKGCFFSPPDLLGWRCRQQSDCAGSLICLQDRCRALCAGDGECKTGETCVQGGCLPPEGDGGPTDGVCLPSVEVCDGRDNDCDGQVDETCLTEGQQCEPKDPSQKKLCAGNLRCIHFDATKPRICMKPCKESLECKVENFLCIPVGSSGVCRQTNCAVAPCLWVDHECLSAGGGTRICSPKDLQAEGSQAGGSLCSPNDSDFCAKGFSCLRSPNGYKGLCTKRCAADSECQSIDPSMTCLSFPLYPASKVCTYACSAQKPCNANFECLDQICVVR